jgi:hypothetical protein
MSEKEPKKEGGKKGRQEGRKGERRRGKEGRTDGRTKGSEKKGKGGRNERRIRKDIKERRISRKGQPTHLHAASVRSLICSSKGRKNGRYGRIG